MRKVRKWARILKILYKSCEVKMPSKRILIPVRVYNGRGECLTAYSPSDICA